MAKAHFEEYFVGLFCVKIQSWNHFLRGSDNPELSKRSKKQLPVFAGSCFFDINRMLGP